MKGQSRSTTTGRRLSSFSLLWLIAASATASALVAHTAPATAFQDAGQYAMTVIGQPDFVSSGAATTQDGLNGPFKLAFDSSGDLWVADEINRRVLEFVPPLTDGMNASVVIGQANFTSALLLTTRSGTTEDAGLTIDPGGDLWVADWINDRVLEFKPPFTSGMNASLELGQPPGPDEFNTSTSFARAPGQFINPHLADELATPVGVTFDSHGDLWVADRQNNRLVEFEPPFTSGMDASAVVGQANLTAYSFSVTPTASSLFGPQDIAFDSSGNLWVADQDDNRILEFSASSLGTNGPQAVLEIGQPAGASAFSTRTASDTPSGLDQPTVIAFDSSGDLWAVDHLNNRVLEFKPPFTDGMSASLEIGQPSGPDAFTSNEPGTGQNGMSNPLGITFDSQGNLWVSDQFNNRVLEFSAQALETAGTTVGIANATQSAPGSAGGSCSEVGSGTLCHLSIDQTASTGVRTDVTGTATGSTANVYSSYLGSEPPSYAAAEPFQGTASYYGLAVAGMADGTVTACAGPAQSATGMAYYSDGAWHSSSSTSVSGVSVCGTIPLSAVSSGEAVLALNGAAPVKSSSQPLLILQTVEAAVLLGGASLAVVSLVARRKKRRLEAREEEEGDEGVDEWV